MFNNLIFILFSTKLIIEEIKTMSQCIVEFCLNCNLRSVLSVCLLFLVYSSD